MLVLKDEDAKRRQSECDDKTFKLTNNLARQKEETKICEEKLNVAERSKGEKEIEAKKANIQASNLEKIKDEFELQKTKFQEEREELSNLKAVYDATYKEKSKLTVDSEELKNKIDVLNKELEMREEDKKIVEEVLKLIGGKKVEVIEKSFALSSKKFTGCWKEQTEKREQVEKDIVKRF